MNHALARRVFAALTSVALLITLLPISVAAQTAPDPAGLTRHEIAGARSAHTKVFQEVDGTKTAVTYTQPIHFRAGDGSWKEIDNEIVPQADGSGFENKAGGVSYDFAATGGAAELVEVGAGKRAFGFGLETAASSNPVVDGNTITYPQVFPGADLHFKVSGETLKELVVLKAPPRARTGRFDLRFPLANHGLTAEAIADGTILMKDASGETILVLPKPFMYDSAPGEAAFSEDIAYVLEQRGQKQFLRVTADAAWLTDPARVYPVYVDPTVGPKTPTLDTFVQSNIVNTPQDTSNELKSGFYTGPEGTFTTRSLMKFDLSVINNGATINSATLSLYENHSYSCNNRVVEVYRITENWGSNVVWSSKPGFAASPADTINAAKGYSSSCPSGRINFNVQSIVSFWKNSGATNEGFGIRAQSESDTFGWKKFASDQTTNKPELTVNYTDPNSPPNEPVHLSPNPGVTTGKLPTFRATYRDPDAGDWGHVEFEIYQSGTCCGNPYRWGSGNGGNPGDTSIFTPFNDMASGTYTWRTRGHDGELTSGWTSTANTAFDVDATKPGVPTVTSGPSDPSATTSPQYYFSGSESGGTFTCRLEKDGVMIAGPSVCNSPVTYNTSGDGRYVFYVKHTDAYDNTSDEGSWAYTRDTTPPPPPSIYSSPSSPSQGRQPTWYFSGENNATFKCRLRDTGSENFETCTSPKTYDLTGRGDKTYYFEVRQVDRSLNESTTASSPYTLDTTAPNPSPSISGPFGRTNNPFPQWTFSGEPGGSYQCQLTGPGVSWGPESCTSPKSYNLSAQSDGDYLFWVRQIDAASNASTWSTREITLDRQAPPPPAITSSPQSPSRNRSPQWSFTGDPSSTFQCQLLKDGVAVYGWGGCTSPKSYDLTGRSDGAYVFQVRQTEPAGNTSAAASSPGYVLDTTAPTAPAITNSPPSPSSNRNPSWSFTGENQAAFTCALRGPSGYVYNPDTCTSSKSYDLTGRPDGTYTFEVYQKDVAGNVSPTASSNYVLDTQPGGPPTIGDRPADITNDATPTWTFSGENGATFVCEIRKSSGAVVLGPGACTSAHTYDLTSSSDGGYVFSVRQRDAAANLSAEATDPFTLDRQAPGTPSITSSPQSPSKSRAPQWSFTGDSGSTFQCQLLKDGVAVFGWAGCTSPKSYDLTGKADGAYVFQVRQTDAAGNTSLAASSPGYVLDTGAPAAPAITGRPSSPSMNRSPSWSFTGESGATFTCALRNSTGYVDEPDTCTSPRQFDLTGDPDGTYTFEVFQTDAAANASPTATSSYVLDTHADGPPTISDGPDDFTNDDSPTWTFSGVTGATFVCELRTQSGTVLEQPGTCTSQHTYHLTTREDGEYVFSVRQRDVAGNVSDEAPDAFTLDRQAPGKPTGLASTTHLPKVGMKAREIQVRWSPPAEADLSGIRGYCFVFSPDFEGHASETSSTSFLPADDTKCTTKTTTTSATLDNGTYWFSVRAIDKARNYGAEETYGPMIVDPQGSLVPLAPTLTDVLAAQSDGNGMEQFYPYKSFDLGTYGAFSNLYSGNVVVKASDFAIPGKGLNVVVGHTYNSGRTDRAYHDTGVGRGWSLSLSDADTGLDGVGAITSFDLNTPVVPTTGRVLTASGEALGSILELTDGDGTVHRFVRPGAVGTRWDSPPGVSLRVIERLDPDALVDSVASYDLVRPDGVTYHVTKVPVGLDGTGQQQVSATWHVAKISDRNGNELTIEYDDLTGLGLPSISKVRAVEIHHNRAGADPVVQFDYDGESGDLDSITALPLDVDEKRIIDFVVGSDGYLNQVVEHPGTTSERTTSFGYTPYERNAIDPLDDVRLLSSVTDALGYATLFRYDDGSVTGTNRLTKVCDRNDTAAGTECTEPWELEYDPVDPSTRQQETRFFTPLDAKTTYLISARDRVSETDPRLQGGNVLRITDAGSPNPITSIYEWVENRLVRKADPNLGDLKRMEYNDLGLVTKVTTAPPNNWAPGLPDGAATDPVVATFLYNAVPGYEYPRGCEPSSDPGPVSGEMHCEAVAELARTVAADNYDTQQRITDFRYDATGNLTDVIGRKAHDVALPVTDGRHIVPDPQAGDRASHMTYFDFGGIKKVEGPGAGADDTTFSDYQANGFAETITDAKQNAKTFEYDGYGMIESATDRGGRETSFDYDLRGNVEEVTTPGNRVTTSTYDLNDHEKSVTSPKGALTSRDDDFTTKFKYQPNEWLEKTESPGANPGEWIVSRSTFNPDGTKATDVSPIDGVTTYTYYANQKLETISAPAGSGDQATGVTTFGYDSAGRRISVLKPRAATSGRPYEITPRAPSGAVAISRASAPQSEAVTEYLRNAHGEPIRVLGPLVKSEVKEEQRFVVDAFGQVVESRRLVRTGKWLVRTSEYDAAGNLTVATQPSGDDGPPLVTEYDYDVLDRLIEQTDPQNPGHRTEFAYLPEGQQELRSDYKGADLERAVLNVYNHDYTVRRIVATDHSKAGTPTLAACNYTGTDFGSGYDPDGHLLVTRTVKGSGGCEGGDVIAAERYEYDHAGRTSQITQDVQAPGMAKVTRDQAFTYRADGALLTSRWAGAHTTTYTHSKGGFMETARDWRSNAATATFDRWAAGNVRTATLGSSASALLSYYGDGSTLVARWTSGGQIVRSHQVMAYDSAGNRRDEDVTIVPPASAPTADTGGQQTFTYDLAGRLTSWGSPYRLYRNEANTDEPLTTYALDDAGNIKVEEVPGFKKTTSTFEDARLESQVATVNRVAATDPDTETTYGFDYSGLGEETTRTAHTVVTGPISDTVDQATATTYDPSGHTDDVDHTGEAAPNDVDYLYSASGDLIARTAGGRTTYYFYFNGGSHLAEEARPSGNTKVRYFNDSTGKVLAEQRFDDGLNGEPNQNSTSWVWLLRDIDGNVATEIKDAATGPVVIAQRAYDPYGQDDEGGTSKLPTEQTSTLGYQSAITDKDTGNLLLGPRVYDPKTDRFTTADFYVGASSDMALGTDPLTGNRYMFAAANPVAFDDDGHSPICDGPGCGNQGESEGGGSMPAPPGNIPTAELTSSSVGPPTPTWMMTSAPPYESFDEPTYAGLWESPWWPFFRKGADHFVLRQGRPGFHWANHQYRLEWDPKNRWHFNDNVKYPKKSPQAHQPFLNGVWHSLGGLAGEVLLLPPVIPVETFCSGDDITDPEFCPGEQGYPPS